MPLGSTILIEYNGVNITSDVLADSVRFDAQQNAVPGTWSMTVKDTDHTHSFTTGKEVTLSVDGTRLVGGYLMRVGRTYPFSAMDTTDPLSIPRYWRLEGSDYNVLFDKRVLRNPANYLTQIPNFTRADMDGTLIKKMCADYLDVSDINSTTYVDNIQPPFNTTPDVGAPGAWLEQGSTMRKQIEDWVQFTGAIWYIDPYKNLHHHAIEDSVMRWGFADTPNHNTITGATGYQGATIGPREIEGTETGQHFVNDAMIWGGSQWAGSGGTVFSREQNAGSIAAHNLWQRAEVHFGEEGYKLQEGVDVRADVIVNGSPGAVAANQDRGLRYPQWDFKFTWFAHDVPLLSGVSNHILPGQLAWITLSTFGPLGTPLTRLLPLRSVAISIPSLDPDGNGYVRFEGRFGLQPDDPFTLWRFLLNAQRRAARQGTVTVVDDNSLATTYGALGTFVPTPTPNGSATVFTVPFGYIIGTTRLYVKPVGANGYFLKLLGSDYTESDSIKGEITITPAPASGESLLVQTRTLAS